MNAARAQLQTAIAALLCPSPDALTTSAEALSAAIADLTSMRDSLQPQPGALDAALDCRRELRTAASLLRRAGEFYEGWSRILGAMTGGYTPQGEAAAPAASHRICLQG